MRTFYVVVAAVAGALIGAAVTLSIVSAQKQVTRSTTFEWDRLEAKTTPIGARRDVMRSATPTLAELEMHITTLNPGVESHPPHRHPEEELLIVKEGSVETLQSGIGTRHGPGPISLQSPNDPHHIPNIG